jgi:hypothetical protein
VRARGDVRSSVVRPQVRLLGAVLLAVSCATVSCVGTTGGEVIMFNAVASGPADARAGEPYTFVVADRFGWTVTLTRAVLHVGAIYFNRSLPVSVAQNTACILPDTYIGQVTTGRDVDLLSPELQWFPVPGEGHTEPPAAVAQVWLTGGRIDDQDDTTPILDVEGKAEKDGGVKPFAGKITIGTNRLPRVDTASAQPGTSPICKQRIVTPIVVSIELKQTGSLLLRMDPAFLFTNVDFSTIPVFDGLGFFSDSLTATDQASKVLYDNLRTAGVPGLGRLYDFEWLP